MRSYNNQIHSGITTNFFPTKTKISTAWTILLKDNGIFVIELLVEGV